MNNDFDVYDFIIDAQGRCFDAGKTPPCSVCPIYEQCIRRAINNTGPALHPKQRVQLALDAVAEEVLLGSD